MSVHLRKGTVKLKDKDGKYVIPLHAVAAQSLADTIKAIDDQGQKTLKSIPDDYTVMADRVKRKIDKPAAADNDKFPRAKDGEIEWVPIGQPTDDQTDAAVSAWLTAHPEATTTVQPGSIAGEQIHAAYAKTIENAYVTPEMFYRTEDDGDWSHAIQKALDAGGCVKLAAKTYDILHPIVMDKTSALEGSGWRSILNCAEGYHAEENGGYVITIIGDEEDDVKRLASGLSNLRIRCNGLASGICDGGLDFSLQVTTRVPIHDILIDKCINGLLTTSMGTVLHDIIILKNGAPAKQGIGIHFNGTDSVANNIKISGFDVGLKISHGANRATNIKSSVNNTGILLDGGDSLLGGCTVEANTDENVEYGCIVRKCCRCEISITAVTGSDTRYISERVPGMLVEGSFRNHISLKYKLGNSIKDFIGNESCAVQVIHSAKNEVECYIDREKSCRIPAVITDFAEMNNIMVDGYRWTKNSIPGALVSFGWTKHSNAIALDQSNPNELNITSFAGNAAPTKYITIATLTSADYSGIWRVATCITGTPSVSKGVLFAAFNPDGTKSLNGNVVSSNDNCKYYEHYIDWSAVEAAQSATVKQINLMLNNLDSEDGDFHVSIYAYREAAE